MPPYAHAYCKVWFAQDACPVICMSEALIMSFQAHPLYRAIKMKGAPINAKSVPKQSKKMSKKNMI